MTPDGGQQLLNRTGAAIAVMLVLTLAGGLYALVKYDLPKDNHDVILILVTAIATNVGTIVQFCFGGSLGSKRKDEIIATQAGSIAKAQDALPPVPGANPTVPVSPGESVTVKATPDATV